MPEKDAWPARFTRAVAGQVHRHRKERGWSAQRLSEECAKLGFDFPRSTLADLESGRRAHVSVAELLVLAAALGIPPLLLIFPVGSSEGAEVLPGEVRPVFRAAQWFAGEGPFPGPEDADHATFTDPRNSGPARPLALYRAHDRIFWAEMRAMTEAGAMDVQAAAAASEVERDRWAAAGNAQRRLAESCRVEAERLRGQARALGLIPPGLVMSLRIPQADGSPETPGGGEDR